MSQGRDLNTQGALLPDRILSRSTVARYLRSELIGRIPDRIQLCITAAVRHRLRRPERMPVSQWCEAYRIMPSADAMPGKWRRELAPHAVRVMDTWALPWVREVWFCGPDQASKTNAMLGCMGYSIDRAPGNIFYTMPSQDAAKRILGQKLIPMLQLTRPLAKLISKRADDTSQGMIRMANGVAIYPAWANSATSTATFSAKYTFNDEVDKWEMVGTETDPIRRLRKRAKKYRFHKHFFGSTPAGKYIYSGAMACQQVQQYANRCPHCGELIIMDTDHIIIPKGASVDDIKRDPGAIGYACNSCGSLWNEADRSRSFEQGDWIIVKGPDCHRPVDVGFLLSGIATPDMKLADIACTIVQAEAGDLSAKRDLAHGIQCIDYEPETTAAREDDHLLRYRSGLPRNAVPLGTAMLGLLADTQQDSFYYELWAYGYAPEIDMRMIRHGILPSFVDLEYLLHQEVFADADGKEFRVQIGLIDSGGTRKGWQKHSRTVEVYDWCSKHRIMIPIKGIWSRRDGDMISYKTVETFPGTSKRIPGGLVRANLKVDYFKDELARRLAIEPDDPGAPLYHDDIDEAFAKHYTAEVKDEESGEWKHDKKKGRNDFWDCNVYAIALREILKTRIPRRPDDPANVAPQRRIYSKGAHRD
ncbi:terminase gpA endonuclease subunit [Syntrophotalea acetylenica]|uniref:Uncharacterized protein n=1 Tax=Syntrophotalea acetylenica TaxID=29542 RepID=A0A1L3GDS2_SYNAC|nr:terminase gpA endonuclease subunit [Syntrophotalea acetylenica]APG24093.1 hypothetical protein A7E75_02895 [Syntrophotalea acetylenica]APG44675.1 hypothetical protein A6070_11520 [Syntrophotalea acetylenica]